MKTLNLFWILLVAILLFGCLENKRDYKYIYTAEVVYTDSAVDTLTFTYKSFKGNRVYVNLHISESGIINNVATSPCLIVGCGFYHDIIACGVRKYRILNEIKIPLLAESWK